PRQIQSGACEDQQEGSSAISHRDEFIFKEEDYPVVDYVLVFVPPYRRRLDRQSQILYLCDSDKYRVTVTP
ncbi:Os07g0542701, partial [Oryza sativa Japonica Group]